MAASNQDFIIKDHTYKMCPTCPTFSVPVPIPKTNDYYQEKSEEKSIFSRIAEMVSPAIETADYHASLNKNSWFYVFDYQSKYGDYSTVCGPGARYDELFFIPVSPAQLNCF